MIVTSSLKVVTTFPFTTESQQLLKEAAATEAMIVTTADELSSHLPDAEIVCSYFMPPDWRSLAPQLRWLQFPGAGVDSLAPSGLLNANSGVIVTTAAGIHAETISEYVFGSMLMFNWNWPQMVRLQDRHIWARSASWYNLGGRELGGQTLGVVGLGHIGRRVAQLGHAFGEFAHSVELMGFALGAALAQGFDAAFVGASKGDGEALGKEIIPGVAGGDLDVVGLSAQANDVVGEDNFSFHKKFDERVVQQ